MQRYLIILILIFTKVSVFSQITFEKTFGTNSYEEIWESKLFSDSTFVMAGYTGFGNAYIIKTNLNGDTIWTKWLMETGMNLVYSITETNSNGIIAAGRTSNFSSGALDIYLVKLDKNGTVLWRKSLGGPGDDTANEIKQTFDNGFIIVGNTYSFGAGGNDFYIIKTDSIGNIIWNKTIGGNLNDNAYSVFETSNHDIVITGLTTENNNVDVMVVRLNQNGIIKWVNKYGGNGDDRGNSIIENDSHELIVNGLYNSDILLMKLDSLGNVLWSKSYGNGANWGYSVKETKNNKLIFCGYQQVASFAVDFIVVKTDQLGDTIWAKNYGNIYNQYATNIEENFDQTLFVTGYSQISASNYDFFIVKTDSLGRTACTNRNSPIFINNLSLIATPKIYTISGGGNVNNGTQTISSLCNLNTTCQVALATDVEKDNSIKINIYPNPASEIISINYTFKGEYNLYIFNMLGSIVHAGKITEGTTTFDVSKFRKGIYLLKLSNSQEVLISQKLIIE